MTCRFLMYNIAREWSMYLTKKNCSVTVVVMTPDRRCAATGMKRTFASVVVTFWKDRKKTSIALLNRISSTVRI